MVKFFCQKKLKLLYQHYLVEKEIAFRLKNATYSERMFLYKNMYAELFSRVPGHPRIVQDRSENLTKQMNNWKFSLVDKFIANDSDVLEFAPGDCSFSYALCDKVRHVFAVDISDQRNRLKSFQPDNFELVLYDGFNLPANMDESRDVIFSDQLIEHLCPEDVLLHFRLVYRILKSSGCYIFRTPHAYLGPHDISKYFSKTPEGFHIKEWTFAEIRPVVLFSGFSRVDFYWSKRSYVYNFPTELAEMIERLFEKHRYRTILRLLLPNVTCVAYK